MITRLFTGPDGQTHVEETEAKFPGVAGSEISKLIANAGAELRRAPPPAFLLRGSVLCFGKPRR